MVIQPPPGKIVAPDGFPASPRPRDAPVAFLDAMDVRIKVFCDEQHCALDLELDEDDPKSWSWVAYLPSKTQPSGEPVSTLRMVPPPHPAHPNGFHDPEEAPYVKLTRVATVPHARGKGLSKLLMQQAFEYLYDHRRTIGADWDGLILTHAQVSVESLYTKIGFVRDEKLGTWDEEGIPHIGMWKQLKI